MGRSSQLPIELVMPPPRHTSEPAGTFQIIIETNRAETIKAIRAILPHGSGMRVVGPEGDPAVLPGGLRTYGNAIPDFTARQHEILDLLLLGLSNKQIGRELELSPYTVRNHVSALLRLLEVPTRKAAMEKLATLWNPEIGHKVPQASIQT